MVRVKRTVLYIGTDEISLPEIAIALQDMGHTVATLECHMGTAGYVPAEEERICQVLENASYQFVISHNFSETIARACNRYQVSYIAWVFDMPQKELYTQAAFYKNNHIFVFDKQQEMRLKEIGIPNVYATSLGVLPRMWMGNEEQTQQRDISFVGQLYGNPYLENVIAAAPDTVQQNINAMARKLLMRWEKGVPATGYLSEESVAYLRRVKGQDVTQLYPYMSEQYYYEAAVISRVFANRERVGILNKLAEQYDVCLYTFDGHREGLSSQVKVFPGVGYGGQAGKIYRQSKINLNISLHCIESGVNQRIFDIMAAGGFVLSNYQKELEELFVPGEEIVLFHNEAELEELVAYYLAHPKERQEIAAKGQQKVLTCYTYEVLFDRVFACVDARVQEWEAEQTTDGGNAVGEDMGFQELQQIVSICLDEVIKLKEENEQLKRKLEEQRELSLYYGKEIKQLWQRTDAVMMVAERAAENAPYEARDARHPLQGVFYPTFYSMEETLQQIKENRKSLCRFGDGEFAIMANVERQKFQKCDAKLAERLKEVIASDNAQVLVAIADHYGNLENYTEQAKRDIRCYMTREVRLQHQQFLDPDRTYHNAYISRPYALFADNRTQAPAKRFEALRQIWQNRDVIIVEGKESRLGVGNDLFSNVKSIRRIEGPAANSFDRYEEILQAALSNGTEEVLYLIAMGATATVLAYDLAKAGFQALDVGHVDLEYEWFLKGTGGRCEVPHKYNNEWPGGQKVQDIKDAVYEQEIIVDLS